MERRIFTAAAAIAALLATTAPASAAQSLEERVLTLTNRERAAVGCSALASSRRLVAAARKHTDEMARTGRLSHDSADGRTFADRVTEQGYSFRLIAENIASGHESAGDVMRAWMRSSGHRANILNCELRDIGVAYAVSARGKPFWTQDFGAKG